ncbi:MAG TPA: M3 family oligoendopeptidase [Acidimicrobiales bacterium]|nr:M3 family oligoendopeptidase [Acidimicrobiales bacterium]
MGATLPRWDISSVFPSLTSREFASAHEAFSAGVSRLQALYDERGVRSGPPRSPSAADVAAVEDVIAETNAVLEQARLLGAYLNAIVTTDARDDAAACVRSQLQAEQAPLDALTARLDGWVASLGADALVSASPVAADHAYPLQRAEQNAAHRMTDAEEDLFAELSLTGSKAWGRLHGMLTSRLRATVHGEELPITVVRGLATHPDAATRRAAFEAELAAWEGAAVPIAAALNAIKGETNAVNRRRGWPDALAPVLWANGVEPAALAALQEAAREAFPDFRRYLRAKAAYLGHDGGLPWYDLFAPLGSSGRVEWGTAVGAVESVFGTYSPALAGLARRALDEQWVDAEPRDGKEGGAYCMSVRADESRVLLNFDGSWDSANTLAHELGHAYHNLTLADRAPLQRRTPMALAETASIFCETLMAAAGLAESTGAERLARLDTDLVGSCQVVVDIDSRFRFEHAVFARRRQGTLGVQELCELMTEAQDATYGDGISCHHPYMWAVKPHYYSTSFYNWPYTFGLLFGIGLFAAYEADPERFRAGYDALLSSTGLASAAELAARFGIDLRSTAFWASSLDVVRARIDEFVALAAAG